MTERAGATQAGPTVSQLPKVQLEILRGKANQRIRPVDVPVFLIGSAHDCDLVLADPAFPEVHTYLYVNPNGVSVRRLGEGPPLAVDGEDVQASPIVDGQTLRIGRYEFAVRIEGPARKSRDESNVLRPTTLPMMTSRESQAIALVRALLDDIRTTLRVENDLALFIDPPRPWRTVTAGNSLLVRKATA